MRPLTKPHAAILDALTAGLSDDCCHKKLDNAPGSFLPAVIEKIGPERFSVTHYVKENGDLVPDPDMEFVRQDGGWYPVALTQMFGLFTLAATTDEHGRIVSCKRAAYDDLRRFAGTFLTNVKVQQGIEVATPRKGGRR